MTIIVTAVTKAVQIFIPTVFKDVTNRHMPEFEYERDTTAPKRGRLRT